MRAFYTDNYVPKRMHLVIVGDFSRLRAAEVGACDGVGALWLSVFVVVPPLALAQYLLCRVREPLVCCHKIKRMCGPYMFGHACIL